MALTLDPPGLHGPAIRYDGMVYTIPKPKRHADVMAQIRWSRQQIPGGFVAPLDSDMGFLTNEGKFLNRKDALSYALQHNLLLPGVTPNHNLGLYSEDVW